MSGLLGACAMLMDFSATRTRRQPLAAWWKLIIECSRWYMGDQSCKAYRINDTPYAVTEERTVLGKCKPPFIQL